jgi:hypothetical protein
MNMYRARRVCTVLVVGLLSLTGCGGTDPAPAPGGPTGPATPTPTAAAAADYDQSDVDGAIITLDDVNLSNFHPFTFPDPEGGMPPRSADCLARWQRQHRDQRESGTFSAGRSFAVDDGRGPFIIQSASVQPGTGARDLIAAQRASYAGPCRTWLSKSGKVTYTAVEDTTLGSYGGDETYGYKVTANGTDGLVVILLGVMIRKGTLLTTVEYAASPSVDPGRAKAIFATAAKLLPRA